MGQRGPAPTPTQVLRLRGSPRAASRPPHLEPEPSLPEPVATLTAAEREIWNRLVPILHAQGIVTLQDAHFLTEFVTASASWNEARETIRREGTIVENSKGDRVCHPALRIMRDTARVMRETGGRFGLSPADRVKLPQKQERQRTEKEIALRLP